MSFRKKLVLFGLSLVAIISIPFLYFEIQRPWRELGILIEKTEARLEGLECAFDKDEWMQMNRFALDMVGELYEEEEKTVRENYYPDYWSMSHSLYLLLDRGALPTEKSLLSEFKENDLEYVDFTYDELTKWYRFWKSEFDKRPGLEAVFRKYRNILLKAHRYALNACFEEADIYLMLDTGSKGSGFFNENVAIVLESLPWWEASYPGEPYNLVESETVYYRKFYDPQFGGHSGFYHNPVFDPERWYLPRFDTDEYGVWFSGWKALKADIPGRGPAYHTLNIDFEASTVKKLMLNVGFNLAALTGVIVIILVFAIRRFSHWLTRPISALVEGAEAVMAQKYDHVVPIFGKDEFSRLIEIFNRMIQWVKEMVNLKETLTKLLSEELAEKAAKDGLVLGGQEVECTVMFTDFAGFSTITASMTAVDVVNILNFYFGELIPIIKKYGGFPDKYIGDAIVAIFGAPVKFHTHADKAVRCAIELQKKLREINDQRRKEAKIVFEMRIGLNSGVVLAGAIGCDLKLEYTSIGETTNLANRMEAKCKIGHVLMSENTYKLIKDKAFDDVMIDETPERELVKGYLEAVSTYGITVHNLNIKKDMSTRDPKHFYVYETAGQ